MNRKNAKPGEIDPLYSVPDNFLFPNIFSSIFIKKEQIQQSSLLYNFAPSIIPTKMNLRCTEMFLWFLGDKIISCFKCHFWGMTLILHGCAFVNMKMEHLRSLGLKWISHVNEIETGKIILFKNLIPTYCSLGSPRSLSKIRDSIFASQQKSAKILEIPAR